MALADAVPPPFSAAALLHGWAFEPLLIIPVIVAAGLYLAGFSRVRRQPRPPFPPYRAWAFIASLVVLVIAVDGPFDTYADVDLAAHMGQHLLLLGLVCPLAVLGAPVTLALRAATPRGRSQFVLPVLHSRVAHALTRPWVAGVVYAGALVATHFTALYNLALEQPLIHDLEHLAYLGTGVLLWGVILGVEPVRHKPGFGARILLVALLMPVMAIISLVFILASHPLYPYYTALPPPWGGRAHVMANQALAGAIMWIPSSLVSLAAVFYVAVEWFRKDEARQSRLEALEDAARGPARRQA
ncbi:MAG: cytochrome c oxidase assembly protein [Actinobacteria bacterium]|nr:cytochrome c oxidase assembly protein [Actinomycetota bacterium]MBO0815720.1 cytochrome c oxidase assembly protein [Actinomycetota bacterium]